MAEQISILLTAKDVTKSAFASLRRSVDDAGAGIGKLQGLMAAGFAGVTVGGIYSKFISETKAAEQEQAQLAAVVRSTGESAGWSVERLNAMATALSQSSTFSEGDINNAQTRLLAYTGVVGEQVPQAMQAIIDMSARLGMDLNQSAETIGKALDVPSKGLTALSKQGFRFTDDQKKLVEQLEATGKTAEAQGIILQALESSYGGAAKAARDTFGGALSALQNNIDSLLTGDSGSMSQMKASVEGLNKTLESEETKAAFQSITGWLAQMASAAVGGASEIVQLINRVQQLRKEGGAPGRWIDSAIQAAGAVVNPIGAAYDAGKRLLNGPAPAPQAYQASVRALDNQIAKAAGGRPAGSSGGGGGGGSKAKKDLEAEAKRAIESLEKQVEKTRELSEVEKQLEEMRRIREGGGVVTESQKQRILQLAAEIDAGKERAEREKREEKDRQEAQDRDNKRWEEGQRLIEQTRTPLEAYTAEVARLNDLLKDGAIDQDTHARALSQAWKGYDDAQQALKKLNDNTDEFSKRAAGNIQDQLGDGLYNVLTGNFDNIGKAWGQMLARMVAEAAAAKLSRSMFGDLVEGGTGSGWFGSVLKAAGGLLGLAGGSAGGSGLWGSTVSAGMGSAGAIVNLPKFDVGTNYVPQDMLAMIHKGEKIVPAKYNRAADPDAARGGGASLTFAPVINIDSRSDRAAIQADVQRTMGEGLRQYSEQLKRAGVLPP